MNSDELIEAANTSALLNPVGCLNEILTHVRQIRASAERWSLRKTSEGDLDSANLWRGQVEQCDRWLETLNVIIKTMSEQKSHAGGATDAPTKNAAPRPDCALTDLIPEWKESVAWKWHQVRSAKGHFLSVWSPQAAQQEDRTRRHATSQEVARWSVEWFKERGYAVECEVLPDGESLGISEVAHGSIA